MRWYWAIDSDNVVANPFVAFEGDLGGYEDWELRSCHRIGAWNGSAFVRPGDKGRDGNTDDVLQHLFGIPIFSPRLRVALTAAGIDGLQFLPIQVLRRTGVLVPGFCVANILHCVAALDLGNSRYERFPEDHFIAEKQGQIRSLEKVVLRREALGELDIIRLREYRVFVAVSERFFRVFTEHNCTGYSFRELEITSG